MGQVISAGGEQLDGFLLRFYVGVERVFLEEAGGKGIYDASVFASARLPSSLKLRRDKTPRLVAETGKAYSTAHCTTSDTHAAILACRCM